MAWYGILDIVTEDQYTKMECSAIYNSGQLRGPLGTSLKRVRLGKVTNSYQISRDSLYRFCEYTIISILTRKFRYLNIKIDLAVIQESEEGGELKSENIITKISDLLREDLGPLAWAFSENECLDLRHYWNYDEN